MPPDIVFLTHDFAGTGVVRNAIRLANFAYSLGLRTEYWVVSATGTLRDELYANIQVRELSGRFAKLPRRMADLLSAPALALAIAKRKPRLIFSAGNHFHLTAMLAWHLAGRPAATRLAGRASNAGSSGLLGRLEQIKYAGMNPVVAVSEELGDQLKRNGMAASRIKVIPNGVDIKLAIARAAAPLEEEWLTRATTPVIVGAGRLCAQKNFALLIEAFAIARKERALRLMLLGQGPELAALEALAARLGVAEDVRFVGFVPNPLAYFSRASLFVLSSRWEGMSNVLIEAMACGCPVVAVRAPTGTAELLDEGRVGPLVPADAEKLAKAMLSRLNSPRQSGLLEAQARRYDLDETLSAYRNLLFAGLGP